MAFRQRRSSAIRGARERRDHEPVEDRKLAASAAHVRTTNPRESNRVVMIRRDGKVMIELQPGIEVVVETVKELATT